MSTRGTIGFRLNDKDILSYNHSDSYPDWLGKEICNDLRELLKEFAIDELKKLVRALRKVTDDAKPTEADYIQFSQTQNVNNTDPWYELLHDHQGDIRRMLQEGIILVDNIFILDSLFCEWGYIVNLDEEVLEIYKGFHTAKEPAGQGRYAKTIIEEDHRPTQYRGCKLITTILLSELKTKKGIKHAIRLMGKLENEA